MVKKLLLKVLTFWALIVTPALGWGQECPNLTSSSISISTNDSTTLCAGEQVSFSASIPSSITSSVTYEWLKNGTPISGESSSTFTASNFANNDKISFRIICDADNTEIKTSNVISLTVNTVRTGSVQIKADKTNICVGETINFSISSASETGNSPVYDWQVNGVSQGSGSTFNSSTLGANDKVKLVVNSSLPCTDDFSSNELTITEKNPAPATPGSITGDDSVCPGISQIYSISPVTNATSYQWTLPSGWTGTSTTNSIQTTSGTSGGTITVIARNECGDSEEQTFPVTVESAAPSLPGVISGEAEVCPGTDQTYTIPAVTDAEEYIWSFPSGWGNPITTTTPEITITTATSGQNGNIGVKAVNSCGESSIRNFYVTVKSGAPATPGNISGNYEVCPGTTETYSVASITNAETYHWILPSGWSGNSTSNSIEVTTGETGPATLQVYTENSCGKSTEQTIDITVKDGIPVNAGAIGITYTNTNEVICPGDQLTLSVNGPAEATNYIWTVPSGWSKDGDSSGQTITVTAGNYGQNGIITVKPENSCGEGSESSLPVEINEPAPEIGSTITGPAEVCATDTGIAYSIPAINHADSYEWSLPTGWSISNGENTNSITVSSSINQGDIKVIAKNECGESEAVVLAVTSTDGVPDHPGEITTNLGIDAVCPPRYGVTFTVSNDTNADYYTWNIPDGWEIKSGEDTHSIVVDITNSAAYNNEIISVVAGNICGESDSSSYSEITVSDFVVTDLGEDQQLCSTTTSVPIDGTISFGAFKKFDPTFSHNGSGTLSELPTNTQNFPTNFTFYYNPAPADYGNEVIITVEVPEPETNKNDPDACGDGYAEVVLYFKPDPTAQISGTTDICNGSSSDITFNGTPHTTITYTINNGTDQFIELGETGEAIVNSGNLSSTAVYNLKSIRYTDDPACDISIGGEATITVNEVPFAELSYEANSFCEDDNSLKSINFNDSIGAYEGGSFTATPAGLQINPNSGTIDPANSESGEYTITYTIPSSLGCEVVELTTNLSITPVPTVSFSYDESPFCSSNTSEKMVNISGTGNWQNGIFSTTTGLDLDATSGNIDPSQSEPGSHTVTYTTPEGEGCGEFDFTAEVVITEVPTPEISYENTEFCSSVTTPREVTLTGSGDIDEGLYSSAEGLSIDSASGEIDPSNSTPGTYTIIYTLEEGAGCTEITAETEITITQLPSAAITYNGPFCASDSNSQSANFTYMIGDYEGGIFTATSEGLAIDSSGAITPSKSTPGEYTVEYTIPADGGCEPVVITTTVSITEVPFADFNYGDEPFCTSDEDVQSVTFTNIPVEYKTGSFSGSEGLAIDEAGNIDAFNSDPGVHTVFYTIPAAQSCEDVVISKEIEIYNKPEITSQPYNVGICSTRPSELSVVASGDDLTYQWYQRKFDENEFQPVSGATSSVLSYSNTTSINGGEYYVTVDGPGSCKAVTSETVSITVDEEIIIEEPVTEVPICGDGFSEVTMKFIAHANGSPLTFTWYKDNVPVDADSDENITITTGAPDENGKYEGTLHLANITTAFNGDYHVEINGPEEFTCSTAVTNPFQLRLAPLPIEPEVEDLIVCQNETPDAFTVISGSNLRWYLSETGEDLIVNEAGQPTAPVPPTNEFGDFYYWVSQTPDVCESPRVQIKVTVKSKPSVPTLTSEEAVIEYCLGDKNATALTATPSTGATLNWYDSSSSTTPLSSAPVPPTTAAGTVQYWVSQTSPEGCEGDRAVISITINQVPSIVIPADITICSGDTIELTTSDANATDETTAFSWDWTANTEGPLSGSAVTLAPTETTTYTITATNSNGCTNTEEFTLSVDDLPVGGNIDGPASVCITNPSGTLTLVGSEDTVARWEYKATTGTAWTAIDNTTPTYDFTSLTISENTTFRAVLTNGVCEEAFSVEHLVTVDPEPIAEGLELLFKGTDRVFMMCEFPTDDYLVPLQTTGNYVGEIIAWQYRRSSQTEWNTIMDGSESFKGTNLTGQQVKVASNNESTLFRVEVQSGACTPNVYSDNATLSIIPSDIAPNPVTVTREAICLDDAVTLSSGTGYGGYGTFIGGAFDNSSIANHGWRVMRYGNNDFTEYTFPSAADNTRPDRWMRTTPKEFSMAGGTGPIDQLFDSSSGDEGNKGFAIVSGDNPSTLETPVFNTFAMEDPVLTFDQAYNLTVGDTIRVQISLDGGNTYIEEPLFVVGGPATSGNYSHFGDDGLGEPNNMSISLSEYAGLPNLRIRWLYDGSTGGIYTIDDIGIPQDPDNVQLVWYYDDDPNNPDNELEQIGEVNQSTVTYTPTKIGWNYFQVNTALVFDTNGDPCQSAENMATIQVYVFDSYSTTATANVGSCGSTEVPLGGILTGEKQGEITEFPVDDTSSLVWTVITGPDGYIFSESHFTTTGTGPAINDPNAIFTPPVEGNYTLGWTIAADERSTCPVTSGEVSFTFAHCTTLDFDGVDDYVDLGTNYTGSSYSIEAWIRPEASTGTIISGPGFEIKMDDLPSSISPNGRWHHIAYTSRGELFIDGILQSSNSITGVGETKTLIGARWKASLKAPENYYSGWIEEVRIWKSDLTQDQIRFMMNQRLKIDATATTTTVIEGEIVPSKAISGSYLLNGTTLNHYLGYDSDGKEILKPFYNKTWGELAGYFRLISEVPDPDLGVITNEHKPVGGNTPDLSLNDNPGRLYNMTTDQENTSPTPYFTGAEGIWQDRNTWARPDVWDSPFSTHNSQATGTPIDWNIVKLKHNIYSEEEVKVLGLVSEAGTLDMKGTNPGRWETGAGGSGSPLYISHYLLLDGIIDLNGESQLLQPHGSIVNGASKGHLDRDQQGTASSYNYNYWVSPVGPGASNAAYSVGAVMLDGSNPSAPGSLEFGAAYHFADNYTGDQKRISEYWLHKFHGTANDYFKWVHIGSTGSMNAGEGFSMKGTMGSADISETQNYTFRGLPNNGNVTPDATGPKENYLVGNPYPSAIDSRKFIEDNLSSFSNENGENVFNGTIYFWSHFANQTHYLEEYIGGYAAYNLGGGVRAVAVDTRIDSTGQVGGAVPRQYIPVGQAFFINTVLDPSLLAAIENASLPGVNGGQVIFQNSQRVFIPENSIEGGSVFHSANKKTLNTGTNSPSTSASAEQRKIWLKFKSPKGYHRQILVTADERTTDNFDLGFDAPMIDQNVEDMFWFFNNYQFVIQGVPDFDIERVLDLGINVDQKGPLSISIDDLDNIPDEMNIYVADSLLKVVHDLRVVPYETESEAGTFTDRFKLVFQDKTQIEEPKIPIIEEGPFEVLYVTGTRNVLLRNPELLDIDRVYLNNMLGQQVHVYYNVPAENEVELPVKRFSAGVYIVKVHYEGGIVTRKVILE